MTNKVLTCFKIFEILEALTIMINQFFKTFITTFTAIRSNDSRRSDANRDKNAALK